MTLNFCVISGIFYGNGECLQALCSHVCGELCVLIECCVLYYLLLLVQYITAVTCIIERNKITHLDSYRIHFVIFIMHVISFVINLFPVFNIFMDF